MEPLSPSTAATARERRFPSCCLFCVRGVRWSSASSISAAVTMSIVILLRLAAESFYSASELARVLEGVRLTSNGDVYGGSAAIVVGNASAFGWAGGSSGGRGRGFVVDFVSIGSMTRLNYLQAQRQTFGSHVSVRHFFNATELDDVEPFCGSVLTRDDVVRGISRFCRNTQGMEVGSVRRHFSNGFAGSKWLEKKDNPVGWMCAQKRSIAGFVKAASEYRRMAALGRHQPLPDYLILADDDAYFDMEAFRKNFFSANDSRTTASNEKVLLQEPQVTAGCRVRAPIHQINFTFAFGGYGIIFSKPSLELMLKPRSCPADAEFCAQLQQNFIGEKELFQNGWSLVELLDALQTSQLYSKYREWERGFCFHSDWILSYFVNYYNVSRHDDEDRYYDDVPQNRLHAYLGSEIYKRPGGLCAYQGVDGCPTNAEVCHYATPTMMEELTSRVRERVPHEFRKVEVTPQALIWG